MTRKHYNAIAHAINATSRENSATDYSQIIYALADVMAGDNPRFNRSRFISACVLTDN